MTVELWYLLLSGVLLSCLWIPFIVGQVMHGGVLQADDYVQLRDTSKYPAWVRRANRAHVNMVEQFGGFAAVVLVGNAAGISTSLTVLAATVFFWARILHVVVFLTGTSIIMIRTLLFTVSWAAIVVFAGAIYAAS